MRLVLALAVTLVLALLLTVAYPDVMIKPGRLSAGHRSLDRDCFACHQALRGAAGAGCLSCHKLDRIGRTTTAGTPLPAAGFRKVPFHASLAETDCMQCHALHASERHRKEPVFRHELLAAAVRENCQSCHQDDRPDDELHRQVAASCASCHGTAGWRPATFDHDRYFRFDAHHPASCRTCHLEETTFSTYSCYGCHEHSPARILAEHQEEGIRNVENCARCHRSGDEDEVEGRWKESERWREDEGEEDE